MSNDGTTMMLVVGIGGAGLLCLLSSSVAGAIVMLGGAGETPPPSRPPDAAPNPDLETGQLPETPSNPILTRDFLGKCSYWRRSYNKQKNKWECAPWKSPVIIDTGLGWASGNDWGAFQCTQNRPCKVKLIEEATKANVPLK